MNRFPLKIVTLDGLFYDGEAEEVIVRTTTGDMGILAGHLNCVAPLGMGRATILIDGQKKYAACIGGILFVLNGEVKLTPTTFEWVEDIDVARCEQAAERARAIIADPSASQQQKDNASAHLKRALVRLNVAQQSNG